MEFDYVYQHAKNLLLIYIFITYCTFIPSLAIKLAWCSLYVEFTNTQKNTNDYQYTISSVMSTYVDDDDVGGVKVNTNVLWRLVSSQSGPKSDSDCDWTQNQSIVLQTFNQKEYKIYNCKSMSQRKLMMIAITAIHRYTAMFCAAFYLLFICVIIVLIKMTVKLKLYEYFYHEYSMNSALYFRYLLNIQNWQWIPEKSLCFFGIADLHLLLYMCIAKCWKPKTKSYRRKSL